MQREERTSQKGTASSLNCPRKSLKTLESEIEARFQGDKWVEGKRSGEGLGI